MLPYGKRYTILPSKSTVKLPLNGCGPAVSPGIRRPRPSTRREIGLGRENAAGNPNEGTDRQNLF